MGIENVKGQLYTDLMQLYINYVLLLFYLTKHYYDSIMDCETEL